MKSHKIKTIIKYFSVIIISIFFISLAISFFGIYSSVKEICIKAKNEYNKDCVISLILFIESDEHSIREKNKAVWALGQLADSRSLPFLNELKKSSSTDMLKLDTDISQYEVKKAIKWCTNGNITKWMYRNRDKW